MVTSAGSCTCGALSAVKVPVLVTVVPSGVWLLSGIFTPMVLLTGDPSRNPIDPVGLGGSNVEMNAMVSVRVPSS